MIKYNIQNCLQNIQRMFSNLCTITTHQSSLLMYYGQNLETIANEIIMLTQSVFG
jgi:hypothetical protein